MTAAGATFKKLGPKTVVIALSMSAMWGLNIVGIKVALEAFPPIWSAFWRLLLGWPALWLWACCGGVSLRLQAHERRPLAILGVFFGFQIILLNVSISLTSAAFAAVLLNAAPIFINVISHRFVPGDRLSPTRTAGLAVAFLGVAIVLLGKPDASLAPHPTLGNILATATAVVIAGRMVYTQRLVQNIEPTKTIFWQVGFSLPVFLVCASVAEPLTVGPLTLRVIAAWLYCSLLVVGVAFMLWVRLLQAHSPGLLSVFVFPTPIFGVLFSAAIYGERPPPELLIGVAAVACGILLVTMERRRESLAPARAKLSGRRAQAAPPLAAPRESSGPVAGSFPALPAAGVPAPETSASQYVISRPARKCGNPR